MALPPVSNKHNSDDSHEGDSINETLPADLTQKVLSFDHPNRNRAVCQKWNQLNTRNAHNAQRAFYRSMAGRFSINDASTKLLVLHPFRTELNSEEIAMGCCNIVNSIDDTFSHLQRDLNIIVFVQEGNHSPLSDSIGGHKSCSITLIGLGRNKSILHLPDGLSMEGASVVFEHVTMHMGEFLDCSPMKIRDCDVCTAYRGTSFVHYVSEDTLEDIIHALISAFHKIYPISVSYNERNFGRDR